MKRAKTSILNSTGTRVCWLEQPQIIPAWFRPHGDSEQMSTLSFNGGSSSKQKHKCDEYMKCSPNRHHLTATDLVKRTKAFSEMKLKKSSSFLAPWFSPQTHDLLCLRALTATATADPCKNKKKKLILFESVTQLAACSSFHKGTADKERTTSGEKLCNNKWEDSQTLSGP